MVHATLIFMVLTLYSRSLILWFMIHTAHSIPLLSHCLVDETLKEHTNSLLDTIPSNGRFLETPQIVWKNSLKKYRQKTDAMTSMIFWFDRMTPDDKIFNEDPSTVIFEKKNRKYEF